MYFPNIYSLSCRHVKKLTTIYQFLCFFFFQRTTWRYSISLCSLRGYFQHTRRYVSLIFIFSLSFFLFSETRCSRNKSEIWNSNIYLTKSSDTIYSPDYDTQDTYPANMSCTWLISLPKNKIQLSFSAFDLQAPGPSCQHGDFVEVRDGEYPDSPVLGTFCGSNIPSDTFSSGSYMLVQFRSDESMEKRGFVTSYCSYDTSNGKVFEKNQKQRPCEAGDLRQNNTLAVY